jgi:outer membrane lipoprotein carrier protein
LFLDLSGYFRVHCEVINALRNLYHFPAPEMDFFCGKRSIQDKVWKSFLLFILLTGFVLLTSIFFPIPLLAETPPLDDLVEKIQSSYEKAEDLKAHFVQETTIKSIRKVEREEGTVYFKKPKKMFWDYNGKPKSKKLIINPRKAWLYIPEDNLVYIQDAKKILNSRLVIRFLTGVGRLKDDFFVRYSRPHEKDARGNYLLELKPRSAGTTAGIERLSLTVGGDNYQIIACSLRDTYGNLTRITFQNISINNNLSDSLFTFTPPPGTIVQTLP